MQQFTVTIPEPLAASCCRTDERRAWMAGLPQAICELQTRWALTLDAPFEGPDVSCSWVARAVTSDGTRAVLKLGMPHMEGTHELDGLRFWNGNGTVQLLQADDALNAMLLERCEPGTPLRRRPEPEQDGVLAGLLRRLWRRPSSLHPFRPLSTMVAHWTDATIADRGAWPDAGLVTEGLRLLHELARASDADVLLATDLHAGNVLEADREPWLVIDPKPFVGDAAYDATQHLLNCRERMHEDADSTMQRFADLLEVDAERVRLWMFARAAAEPRDRWDAGSMTLAHALG